MDTEPRRWPDLVGKEGAEAVEIIKKESGTIVESNLQFLSCSGFTNVVIVKPGSMVTMDYRTDRVRVHVDNHGKVATQPTVG